MTTAPTATTLRTCGLLLAVAACLGTSAALADDATPASRPTTDQADATMNRLLGPASTAPATRRDPAASQPAPADRTPAATVAPNAAPKRLLREGTFLVDRMGHVRETETGDYEFVFAADNATAAAADPPMRLVPNLNLMAIDSQSIGTERRRYRVTGRVTEYRGRNYLILEKVVFLDD